MIKMFRYHLYPNCKQRRTLNQTLELCRKLYNNCLAERIVELISCNKQQKRLVTFKKEHQEYKEVNAEVLIDVVQRLDRAFQNFFRRLQLGKKPGYPRFKSRDRFHSFTYWNQARISGEYLQLHKIGNIKLKLSRKLPENSRLCNCIIKKSCDNWYACFSVECNPQLLSHSDLKVGIDVGITRFAALSDKTFIENSRFFESSQKKLRRVQRKLSRCKKDSNNRKHIKLLLQKFHQHIANQRQDFLHKCSTALIKKYGVLAVENLDIEEMIGDNERKLQKQILDASWATFIFMLSYKAAEAGRILWKVPAPYSSQKCFSCKFVCKENRTREKFLCLSCGYSDHADTNASKNILSAWIELSGDNVEEVVSSVA